MSAVSDQFERIAPHEWPERRALRRLDGLARLLDSAVPIPFAGGARIGLDSLIGLVPVVGDLVSAGLSAYLIAEAHGLGLPKRKLARMAGNAALDAALGMTPVIGDFADIFFRANLRNIALIRAHLESEGRLIDHERRDL
jgi:hypothetical protein